MGFDEEIISKIRTILSFDLLPEAVLERAESDNSWFDRETIKYALEAVSLSMLDPICVSQWLSKYHYRDITSRRVGIIAAGNIPLAVVADLVACVVCRAEIYIKPSSKDSALVEWLSMQFRELGAKISPLLPETQLDALIATGSNNSNRYFNTIYPGAKRVLRNSRTSVAILDNQTTDEDIRLLWSDVFVHYGLGCRNVSHLFVEVGFDISRVVDSWQSRAVEHPDYLGSYTQKKAVLRLSNHSFVDGNYYLLQSSSSLFPPLGLITYSYFGSRSELEELLDSSCNDIQCVVGKDYVGFGQAQSPRLVDYADSIDTMEFLLSL